MRVALTTWHTENDDWPELASISEPGKAEYCKRHGYDFVPQVTDYHGFRRMQLVAEVLPHYDMVLSVDSDALIMNHTIKAERLYREGKGIVISEDMFGVNDGVFAVFNTPLAKQFIAAYLGLGLNPNNHHDSQQMFTYVAMIDLYRDCIAKVPQTDLNSYRNDLYGRPSYFTGTYNPGDWILQFPGMSNTDRMPHMREALKDVIR